MLPFQTDVETPVEDRFNEAQRRLEEMHERIKPFVAPAPEEPQVRPLRWVSSDSVRVSQSMSESRLKMTYRA